MRILVTGGTGFIGKPLVHRLLLRGDDVTVLSRRPTSVQAIFGEAAEAWSSLSAWTPDRAFDAVINLAGEPIIDRPWTAARTQVLLPTVFVASFPVRGGKNLYTGTGVGGRFKFRLPGKFLRFVAAS